MSKTFLFVLMIAIIAQDTAVPRFKLSGAVMDQMDRGIPGVSISLVRVQDKEKREIKSDKLGRFEFAGLRDGSYQLETKQMGFRTDAAAVDISGANLERTFRMRLGGMQETIKVSGRVAGGGQRKFPQPQNAKLAAQNCVDSGDGGVIRPPQKLMHVIPGYPPLMLESRIEGTVVLTGQLSADGSPLNLKAVGTPNVGLTAAAMDAARQFLFSPTLLNCVPTPIDMEVTFVFSVR